MKDQDRYKLIFGMPNFEFGRKRNVMGQNNSGAHAHDSIPTMSSNSTAKVSHHQHQMIKSRGINVESIDTSERDSAKSRSDVKSGSNQQANYVFGSQSLMGGTDDDDLSDGSALIFSKKGS